MPVSPTPPLDETISEGQTDHILDHEKIAAALNASSATDPFIAALSTRLDALDALGDLFDTSGAPRIPLSGTFSVDGPASVASGSSNTVGLVLSPQASGDFTGIGGSDAGFFFGRNDFTLIRQDARGLSNVYGVLTELNILADGGHIDAAWAQMFDLRFWGAPAAATIDLMETVRINAPSRSAGATGGTVLAAYTLVLGAPTIGVNANISLLSAGIARFQSRIDANGNISSSGYLEMYSGFSRADGAVVLLDGNAAGNSTGSAVVSLSKAGSALVVHDGTNYVHELFREGHQFIRNSAVAPATPTDGVVLYAEGGAYKCKGSSGTVTTLAAP